MISTQEIRDQLARVERGALPSASFEEWLVAESWDMRRWASKGLQRLIENIQAAFIANHDGAMPDEDLKGLLRSKFEQLESATASITAAEVAEIVRKHADYIQATTPIEEKADANVLVTV